MTHDFSEMSHFNFINLMHTLAHPIDDSTAVYAHLMDEAARRIEKLEEQVLAWEASADFAGVDTPDKLVDYIIAAGCS